MDAINQALESFRPALQERYIHIVTTLFTTIQAKLGITFKGVHNDWTYAKVFRLMVAPNVTRAKGIPGVDAAVLIDGAKLDLNAKVYAASTIEAWKSKIELKLGELENASVEALTGCTFRILGTKANRAVVIEQTVILKTSSKGVVFNQFPARIYVDGKFISEAKYKAISA